MSRIVKNIALVTLFAMTTTSCCQAGFFFAFNTSGTNQDFFAAPGSLVAVPVYLVQTDGEDRLSSIGLYSAGVSVTLSHGSGPLGDAIGDSAILGTHWDPIPFSKLEVLPNRVVIEGIVPDFVPAPVGSNAVHLGTIQFQAGVLGNVTNLAMSFDRVTPFANTLMDTTEVTPITLRSGSITAVPEPTSFCMLSASILVAGLLRRQRSH